MLSLIGTCSPSLRRQYRWQSSERFAVKLSRYAYLYRPIRGIIGVKNIACVLFPLITLMEWRCKLPYGADTESKRLRIYGI